MSSGGAGSGWQQFNKYVTYSYDASGSRIAAQPWGMATTTFPTKEFNTDGTKKTWHLFANGSDVGTIETATSTPAIFWNHGDHLRSTSLVTDVSGAISEDVRYAPFGKIVENTGAHREQRKFTSHEYDSHAPTNYTYAKARYLDTSFGRFLSEDSEYLAVGDKDFKQNYNRTLENFLSDPQLANSYSYASNNPLRFYDPDGRQVALAPSFGQVAAGILALGAAIASAPEIVIGVLVIGTIAIIGATINPSERALPRGLAPDGLLPPIEGPIEIGPPSRPSAEQKGEQRYWDSKGGEWRYAPEDKWHNPHWDYNPHKEGKLENGKQGNEWDNIPIGDKPVYKSEAKPKGTQPGDNKMPNKPKKL